MSKKVFSITNRLLLLAITSILLAIGAEVKAAPALRGSFTVKQADGTMLTIEQFGDEYHHWTATTDGPLYDLMGRKILHPKKGLYITSGKKIVIK